jgi:hypothetical protein
LNKCAPNYCHNSFCNQIKQLDKASACPHW